MVTLVEARHTLFFETLSTQLPEGRPAGRLQVTV
jgi:hypothetical protein